MLADPPGGIYELGAVVTLTAVPDSGWKFVKWMGDVKSSDNPISVQMDGSKTVKALFATDAPARYTVNVYVFSGGGSVQMDPPGPTFQEGARVALTAVADDGWEFKTWGGDMSGNKNPDTLLVDGDKSVMATFAKIPALVADHAAPTTFKLQQNYPNPFNPSTTITYALPRSTPVRLTVYNGLGRRIVTLVDARQTMGVYSVQWSGQSADGRRLQSGVYLYRLQAGDFVETKKMMLIQ